MSGRFLLLSLLRFSLYPPNVLFMRLFTLLFFVLLTFLISTGCNQDQKSTPSFIHGVWKNTESKNLYLVRAADMIGYSEFLHIQDTSLIDSLGDFTLQTNLESEDFFFLCQDNGFPLLSYPFLLSPGDSIHIDLDNNQASPLSIHGKCSDSYQFFDDWKQHLNLDSIQKERYDDFNEMQPDTFINFLSAKKEIGKDIVANYQSQSEGCNALQKMISFYADFSIGNMFFNYLKYHNYYANDTFLYFAADSAFYQIISDIPTNPGEFFFLYPYQQFVEGKLNDLFHHSYDKLPDSIRFAEEYPLKLELIKKHFAGVEADLALLSLSNEFSFGLANPLFFEQTDAIKKYFQHHFSNEVNYNKFLITLTAYEKLKPGNPSPPLSLTDVDGNLRSLEEFKGKIVYLDFWGTWCYPCLQELPESRKLQELYKDKDVAFIYVALEYGNEDIQRWKNFVSGKESLSYAIFLGKQSWPGVHLVAEKQFRNPVLKPWLINYAPTYALLDKNGNIIKGRAPRPSNPEIIDLINEYINK